MLFQSLPEHSCVCNLCAYLSYAYLWWNVSSFACYYKWIFLILNFESFLYILSTISFLDVWFTNIFSQSLLLICLFTFLRGFSSDKKFSILLSSSLSTFLYVDHALVPCLRSICLDLDYKDLLLRFFLCFIVLHFIYKPLMYFKLILV